MRLFRVNGDSMNPILQAGNLCIYQRVKHINDLHLGDIIIIKVMGMMMIKRVVGLPMKEIRLHRGVLTIDGVRFEEHYLKELRNNEEIEYYWKPKSNELVVLGDNAKSQDSRYYGCVPFVNVIGRMRRKLF